MAGALVGDAQACTNPIELGDAHGAGQFGFQQDREGVRWGVGMGLAIGDDPVLDRRKHQPGVPMALVLKDGVSIRGKAGLPAKGGGA